MDNYAELLTEFDRRKRGSDTKKLADNTYLRLDGDDLVIRLHDTDIVRWNKRNVVTLNSGGWRTPTTKQRINCYLPNGWSLSQRNRRWYLRTDHWTGERWERGPEFEYREGIRIGPKGPIGYKPPSHKAAEAMNKRIDKYLKGFTQEEAARILAEITVEDDEGKKGLRLNGGDCWYCLFGMGEAFGDHHHLSEHLKDRYYMGSLLFNALKERKYGDPWFVLWLRLRDAAQGHPTDLQRDLRRYLRRRLVPQEATT